jgi:hypothetical protein
MIYCIWYPAGGFGHFVNAVLTLHGKNFVRPCVEHYEFDNVGTSHNLPTVAPKYYCNPKTYDYQFDNNKSYSVLIDNGNHDESTQFCNFFPTSKIIKICYTDASWPIFAKTTIVKTINNSVGFESLINIGSDWSTDADWATREKYFLYLKDHYFRHKWKPELWCMNLLIDDLLTYTGFKNKINTFGIDTTDFENLWTSWYNSNRPYLEPVITAQNILKAVEKNQSVDISNITDLWTQAILYFNIWVKYQVEVPHNDYSNWFTSTDKIATMLNNHGVFIDTH